MKGNWGKWVSIILAKGLHGPKPGASLHLAGELGVNPAASWPHWVPEFPSPTSNPEKKFPLFGTTDNWENFVNFFFFSFLVLAFLSTWSSRSLAFPTAPLTGPSFWISLSSRAWHARETGSTHPGEKGQLFTASCSAHKQQGEASTHVATCLFQNVSTASMAGKSSGNVSNPLHNFLESSFTMFTPQTDHRWQLCFSIAYKWMTSPPFHWRLGTFFFLRGPGRQGEAQRTELNGREVSLVKNEVSKNLAKDPFFYALK